MRTEWIDDSEGWVASYKHGGYRGMGGPIIVLERSEDRIVLKPSEHLNGWCDASTCRRIVPLYGSAFRIERRVEGRKDPYMPSLGDKVSYDIADGGGGFTVVGAGEGGKPFALIFKPTYTGGHNGMGFACSNGGRVPGFPKAHRFVSITSLSLEEENVKEVTKCT